MTTAYEQVNNAISAKRAIQEAAALNAMNIQPGTALILKTSGSSGAPRYHFTPHNRLREIVSRDAESMGLSWKDRLVTFCPLNHGLGLYAVLTQLSVGGGVILPHEFSRAELRAALEQFPTWMVAIPSLLPAIERFARRDADIGRLITNLRFVRVGGAPLDQDAADSFEALTGVPVLNGYGMTEVPCIARNTLEFRRKCSVGQVVPGVHVEIDTGEGSAAPIGTSGTIWVETADTWQETCDIGHLDSDGFLFIDQAHKGADRKTWKTEESKPAVDWVWVFPIWCCVFTFIMCELGLFSGSVPVIERMLRVYPWALLSVVTVAAIPISIGLIAFKNWVMKKVGRC